MARARFLLGDFSGLGAPGGTGLSAQFANVASVQDLTELTALPETTADKSSVFVEDEKKWYHYDEQSIAAPSSPTILTPDTVTHPAPGRWIRNEGGPPTPHTHTSGDITDFSTAVLALVPEPTAADKDLVASVTTADGDQATASTLTAAPFSGSYPQTVVNGTQVVVGNGVKTEDCYFSNDGGTTALAFSALSAGDTLHWNGSIAGFELDANDRIDINYVV